MSFLKFLPFFRTNMKISEFHKSCILNAEPIRKKKSDSSIIAYRLQRKAKKIEKELKKLDKKGRTLKPILEIEGDFEVLRTLDKRTREPITPSEEEEDYEINLKKQWAKYLWKQNILEQYNYKILMHHQMNALEQLKDCSEDLYRAAIEADFTGFPFKSIGPVSAFLDNYESPDGETKDSTPNYRYEVQIDKRLIVKADKK